MLCRRDMGRTAALAAVLLLCALSSIATAESGTVSAGVSLGRSIDEGVEEPSQTMGLWGRVGLGSRFSGQLELQQLEASYGDDRIRSGTALLVLDVLGGSDRRLMPMIVVGAGLDRATIFGNQEIDGRHYEGGAGLEYRSADGLTLGLDLRLGGRSLDNGDVILADAARGPALLIAPPISEGPYKSLRLTLGLRF